jgi:hypothetical protein
MSDNKFFKFLNVSSNSNREFWFGHALVLVATVFSVYLAASAGLKSTIEFELIKSDRDSYYMRSALLDEVKDNAQQMQQWGSEYRSGNARKFIGNEADFTLDDYIWQTMQGNPGTFQIPSDILTGIRRYYRLSENTLRYMAAVKPAADRVDAMLEATKGFNKELVPLLEKDIAKLRLKLDELKIAL